MVMSNFPIFSVGISVVRVCETNSCYMMLINMVDFQSSNVDINYKNPVTNMMLIHDYTLSSSLPCLLEIDLALFPATQLTV